MVCSAEVKADDATPWLAVAYRQPRPFIHLFHSPFSQQQLWHSLVKLGELQLFHFHFYHTLPLQACSRLPAGHKFDSLDQDQRSCVP